MRSTIGRTAARIHLLLVLAVTLAGVGVLLMIGAVMLSGDDYYARDMAVLALVITAPLWLFGLAAVVELVLVLRGRPVTRRRALAWAVIAVGGAALLAAAGGQVGLATALLTRPDLVALDWPVVILIAADGMGARYFYLDDPTFWLPPGGLLLGAASLVALALDRAAGPRQAPDAGNLGHELVHDRAAAPGSAVSLSAAEADRRR